MKPRSAFTIIELLVVIAIIATLAALTAGAITNVMAAQKKKSTELAVKKLYTLLDRHWKAVIDEANDDWKQGKAAVFGAHAQDRTTVAPIVWREDSERARIMWIKSKLKQQFPMRYDEAIVVNNPADPNRGGWFNGWAREPAYVDYLARTTASPPGRFIFANRQEKTQPAACLLMALTARGRRGVSLDEDLMNSLEKVDTDNDGIPELVDSWGTPLMFFRFPTGNLEVDNLCPATSGLGVKFRDPLDPAGKLLSPLWYPTTIAGWYGGAQRGIWYQNSVLGYGYKIKNTLNPAVPAESSIYTVPVVVSCGPDKKLGYADYSMTPGLRTTPLPLVDLWGGTDPDGWFDNICSYNLR